MSIHSTITWLYYDDVLAMQNFHQNVDGLEMVTDQGWAKIYQVTNTGCLAIVDGRRGMHKDSEVSAVNVGFIVDDLDGWFDYVKTHQPFDLREDEISTGPENKYRAFVGYDPGGYYLEFDKFYAHEDNEVLMRYLEESNK